MAYLCLILMAMDMQLLERSKRWNTELEHTSKCYAMGCRVANFKAASTELWEKLLQQLDQSAEVCTL